jgi:hypothetical protein
VIGGSGSFDRTPDRTFHIAATGDLTLRGVATGRLFNRGTLTLSHSAVRDNSRLFGFFPDSAVVMNFGTLRIVDSIITRNGGDFVGAIASSGSLQIVRSSIDGNGGNFSIGGMSSSGITIIEDSAITSNEGTLQALTVSGTTTITNTTIAGNFGGILIGGTAKLTNVTIADNFTPLEGFERAAGITVIPGSSVQIVNSIVARNSGPDCSGNLTSLGNNILGDMTDCVIDLRSSDFVGDPRLGELVDDPTLGHLHVPLLADSPAIDAANRKACPNRDQLGHKRVDGDGGRKICDIGAVEFIPEPRHGPGH